MATRPAEKRLNKLLKALKQIVEYPPRGHGRRTGDGYPTEFAYDKFAYQRMVDSYRDAIRKAVADAKE